MLELLGNGFMLVVSSPMNLLVILLGVALGIILGALPGFTATMGIAVVLPLTYGMSPVIALTLLTTIFVGGIHGGSVPAILLKTPGTPAAAATTLDGYPMAMRGDAGKALGIDAFSSGTGGFIATIILSVGAYQLARFSLRFGPPEYFALGILGITVIASLSTRSVLKGLIAAALGLVFSTVGFDPMAGFPRFAFGMLPLYEGVSLVPTVIGLFAISQVFQEIEVYAKTRKLKITEKVSAKLPSIKEIKKLFPTILRSSLIGTVVGAIPGPGTVLGAFIAYGEAKRHSKHPEQFGKGAPEGVAAAEAGNNSAAVGALIPTFSLGIPGEAASAVLLGGLMIVGLRPGPMLLQQSPDILYAVFAALLIANIVLIFEGLFMARFLSKIVQIPRPFLLTVILLFSILGTYGINYSVFDIGVGLFFGVLGYGMTKLDFPVTPVLLSIILGPIIEANLRRTLLISQGDITVLFTRPITAVLLALAVISLFLGIRSARKLRNIERDLSAAMEQQE